MRCWNGKSPKSNFLEQEKPSRFLAPRQSPLPTRRRSRQLRRQTLHLQKASHENGRRSNMRLRRSNKRRILRQKRTRRRFQLRRSRSLNQPSRPTSPRHFKPSSSSKTPEGRHEEKQKKTVILNFNYFNAKICSEEWPCVSFWVSLLPFP